MFSQRRWELLKFVIVCYQLIQVLYLVKPLRQITQLIVVHFQIGQ
jgi:hypothetical protein